MPVFEYRALRQDGSLVEGRLDAAGRQEAYRQLDGQRLRPVRVEEKKADVKPSASRPLLPKFGRGKVSAKSVEDFTRQLANLLAAGVPLARALQLLSRESASASAAAQWKKIHDLVIDGVSLADAMAQAPHLFPRIYIAMVQAGEMGGFLSIVLSQIADFQSRQREIRSKVSSALIYPAILLVLAIGVLIFLLVFFIPRFKTIFAGFGAQLPLLTRAIVGVSEAMIHYGFFIAMGVGLIALLFHQWLSSQQGRRTWERLVLKAPLVGPLKARFAMTRFCRMLGTLILAGVPLLTALRVARESLGNQTLIDTVASLTDRVKQGDGLSQSLADHPILFPPSVVEMVAVAEETGRLDEELIRLATTAENDLERQLRTTVALAEPLMLFVMAAFIGVIFVGMVIPIFTIQEYIK